MDFSSKSPKKEFSKDITSKIETHKNNDKCLKPQVDKSDQKPNIKSGNKIERPKIDINEEPRKKIQREKIDLLTPARNKINRPKFDLKAPTRNKIEPRQIDPKKESKHKLIPRIIDPKTPSRHKIEPRQINSKEESKHKLQPRIIDPKAPPIIRIKDPRLYRNLLDPKIQNIFKKYYNETGKYSNYGRNLRKEFVKWVEDNNPEISEKINVIQNNQEISKYIKDGVQNSNISQSEIASKLHANGLFVSRKTIGNYALKEVFKGNQVEYKKRFDRSLDTELKERIINRLNKELLKYSEGTPHDSLYKIATDFPEISKSMIDKIAKNEISQNVYRMIWPATSGTVAPKTKQNIRNLIEREAKKGTPRSLRNISENFPDVSISSINTMAKQMYPERYKNLWPAIEKIPKEIKIKIRSTLKDEAQKESPRTLREIHRDFPEVGTDSIKRIAKQFISKDVRDEIWPPLTSEIPNKTVLKIRQTLKDEINKPIPRPLNEIRKIFDVSHEYVRKLAKKTISKLEYEKIWKGHEPITNDIKNKIIQDIVNTNLNISEIAEKNGVSRPSVSNISQIRVFQDNIDDHRERFPIDENLEIGSFTHLNLNSLFTKAIKDISNQKYYSEPNIFSDNRRPDGLILEDGKFIHQRLTNPQTGEYLRDKLELNPDNLNHIKSIQLDFTNDITNENLINKIEKYQSKDSLFVIIGTRWNQYNEIKPLPNDDIIKYPENVRVVSHSLGAILIGLDSENKGLYDKIIDFNIDHDLDALKTLYKYNLSSINNHNTEELKEDLIQKGFIKDNFSEYFDLDVQGKKDGKEKQLDLDHFLNC